jgi:hypothetical protein
MRLRAKRRARALWRDTHGSRETLLVTGDPSWRRGDNYVVDMCSSSMYEGDMCERSLADEAREQLHEQEETSQLR